MPVNGPGVAAVGIGALFVFGGIKGFSPLKAFQNITRGQSASQGQTPATLANPNASKNAPGPTGPVSSNQLVQLAMQYDGDMNYQFGGVPQKGKMDCSSLMNTVIGLDGQQSIPDFPNGSYDGSVHGPSTISWLTWGGCQTISKKDARGGDLAIGPTHMGMFINNSDYISDHDVAEGVSVKPVSTFPDAFWIARRLK